MCKKIFTPLEKANRKLYFLSTFIVFFLLVIVSFCGAEKPRKLCFKEVCVDLEVVDTDSSRTKGLMFRKELARKSGMFFIFPAEDIYPFWMKNTLIPLDIIWMDKDLRIARIKSSVLPCETSDCPVYNPGVKAQFVLEVHAGFCDFYHIKNNEKARLEND